MAWEFGLWALDGTRIGEVNNASERRLSLPLSSVPSASFRLDLSNPAASEITDRECRVLLTAYQNFTLRFVGECTGGNEVCNDQTKTLAVNFAGPLWRLQYRLTGKVASPGYSDSSVARGAVAQTLLETANAEHDTGIRTGTIASLHPTSVGPWYYKPVGETYSEMSALKLYPFESITTSPAIVDTFTTGTSALTGRVLEAGTGTWTAVRATAPDFQVASGLVTRSGSSDVDLTTARLMRAGTTDYANIMAQVDFGHVTSTVADSIVMIRCVSGVGDLYHVMAIRTQSNTDTMIAVYKCIGGEYFQMASVVTAVTTDNQARSMRLQADTAGNWFLWDFEQGAGAVFPMLSGQDDDLASGGVLEAGGVGFGDTAGGPLQPIRTYDNFYAKVPTVAVTLQGFEFEFVPSEPTADTNQSGVVGAGLKIATLNVSARLGSDKPDAIWEYGSGNPSVKSYERIWDRTSPLNQGYTLTDTAVRVSKDDVSIAEMGLFEQVVPNDLGDAGLRQALADAHVIVRKETKQTVTFAPSSTAPVFGTDYSVGDTIRARAMVDETQRLNGTLRVYGVEISIDDEGKEEINPILVAE